MSERFEAKVREWYNFSRTANLEYLNLERTPPETLTLKQISHNQDVIYDRLLLHCKVSYAKQIRVLELLGENQRELADKITKLHKDHQKLVAAVAGLEQEILNQKPLTKAEVKDLVQEIAQQPKLVEEQALKLTQDLTARLEEVKTLVIKAEATAHRIEDWSAL